MDNRISERCALTSLIALMIYGLACMWPVAWSPDSQKLVFPVFGKDMIERLVMTDLSAKFIREVARVDAEKGTLSAAAWSPDGKWIAYMKSEEKAEEKGRPKTVVRSVMLQESDFGGERTIFRDEMACANEKSELFWGPQWTRDSKSIMAWAASDGKAELIFLDLDGNVKRKHPLEGGLLAARSASLSPNGKYVAHLGETSGKSKGSELVLVETKKGARRLLGTVSFVDQHEFLSRPAWSPDSRFVYGPALQKGDNGQEEAGPIRRFDVKKGESEVVWKRANAAACGVSASGRSRFLAVAWHGKDPDCLGVDTVDLSSGESVPVYLGRAPAYGASISPDGERVAFYVPADQGKPWVGVVASRRGDHLCFFLPEKGQEDSIVELSRERLDGALRYYQIEEELGKADDLFEQKPPLELPKLFAALDQRTDEVQRSVSGGKAIPVLQEAIAYLRVRLRIDCLTDGKLPAERPKVIEESRRQLASFLTAYPDHPLGPELEKEIQEAGSEKDQKATAPTGRAE